MRCRKSGGNLQTIHIKTAKFEAFLFDFTVYPFIYCIDTSGIRSFVFFLNLISRHTYILAITDPASGIGESRLPYSDAGTRC